MLGTRQLLYEHATHPLPPAVLKESDARKTFVKEMGCLAFFICRLG